MTNPTPDWFSVRRKLTDAQKIMVAAERRAALLEVVDEIIKVFEDCAPTPWEAHFLLHAIKHIRGGFEAVATEELLSVLKPREEQCDLDEGDPRPIIGLADSNDLSAFL